MPVDQEVKLKIKCDNPECPGHDNLSAEDRTGWIFISSEVYGEPTAQHVFGSVECVNAATAETVTPIFSWENAGDPEAVRAAQAGPAISPTEASG
jgi:hypothetical protein